MRAPAARGSLTQHSEAFLRLDSPPCEATPLNWVPLFPRTYPPNDAEIVSDSTFTKPLTRGLGSINKLPGLIARAAVILEEEEEEHVQHMVVVNGWGGYMRFISPEASLLELRGVRVPFLPFECPYTLLRFFVWRRDR